MILVLHIIVILNTNQTFYIRVDILLWTIPVWMLKSNSLSTGGTGLETRCFNGKPKFLDTDWPITYSLKHAVLSVSVYFESSNW